MTKQTQPCRGVLRSSAIVADSPQRESVLQHIEDLLMEGSFSNGLSFEKLSTGRNLGSVFSVRLNIKARLLITKSWVVNGWYWIMLNVLEQHEYERSQLLQSDGLEKFLNTHRQALEAQVIDLEEVKQPPVIAEDSQETLDWIDFEYFNEQLIVLNQDQELAIRSELPLIINGIPGSGKTCVAMSLMMHWLEAFCEEEQQILYVTTSPDLINVMKKTWRESPAFEEALNDKLAFLSYTSLLHHLYPDTRDLSLADEKNFLDWFKQHRKNFKLLQAREKEIYQELRLISGYTNAQYLALGQRQSLFQTPEERQLLCLLYWLYCDTLASKKQIDVSFYPHCSQAFIQKKRDNESIDSFDFSGLPVFAKVLVDEAQDFSGLQQRLLMSTASNRKLAIFMDTNQSLSDSLSKFQYLKNELKIDDDKCIRLSVSFRCPKRVLELANTMLAMKYHVSGGLSEKGWDGYVNILDNAEEGHIVWNTEHKDIIDALQSDIASTKCAVITSETHLPQARALFPGGIVLTPQQAKGLEYDKVIAYRLLSDKFFEEMNPLLAEFNPGDKKQYGRPKSGDSHFEWCPKLNTVFTGLTRTRNELHFIEPKTNEDHKIGHVIRIIRSVAESRTITKSSLRLEISSANDWLKEAKCHIRLGNIELAKIICEKRLGYDPSEFEVFLTTVTRDTPSSATPLSSPAPALSPSPVPSPSPVSFISQGPTRKTSKKAAKLPPTQLRKELHHYFLNPDENMKWLMDCPDNLDYSLLDVISNDKDKCQVLIDLIKQAEFPLSSFIKELCRTRTSKFHENDSGFAMLTRGVPGINLLKTIGAAELLRVIPPKLLIKVMTRPLISSDDFLSLNTPLYCLCEEEQGIAFLMTLVEASPEEISTLITPEVLLMPIQGDEKKQQTLNAFFILVANEAGIDLLLLLTDFWHKNDISLSPLFPSMFSNEIFQKKPSIFNPMDSIFYNLVSYKKNKQFLIKLINLYPEVMDRIEAKLLYSRYQPVDTPEKIITPFHWLCEEPHELLIQIFLAKPELMSQLPASLFCHHPGAGIHDDYFPPVFCLSQYKEGLQLLKLFPDLWPKISGSDLTKVIDDHPNAEYINALYFMLCEPVGATLLNLMLLANPRLAQEIGFRALIEPILPIKYQKTSYVTCLSLLTRHPEANQIFKYFIPQIKQLTEKDLFKPIYRERRTNETCMFLIMAQTMHGQRCFFHIDNFAEKIRAPSLSLVSNLLVDGNFGDNALYWLCSNEIGQYILSSLFEHNPQLIDQIPVEAWTMVPKKVLYSQGQKNALFWVCHLEYPRSVIMRYPFILRYLTHDQMQQFNGFVFKPMTNPELLRFFAKSPEGIQILTQKKFLLDHISKEAFLLRDSANLSAFCLLSKTKLGVDLISQQPRLLSMLTMDDLLQPILEEGELQFKTPFYFLLFNKIAREFLIKILAQFPDDTVDIPEEIMCQSLTEQTENWTNSIAFLLCASNEGLEILTKYPILQTRISLEALHTKYDGNFSPQSLLTIFEMLSCSYMGLQVLDKMLQFKPDMLHYLDMETLNRQFNLCNNQYSILYNLTDYINGRLLLSKYPQLLELMTAEGLCRVVNDIPGYYLNRTSLLNIVTHVELCNPFFKLIDKIEGIERYLSAEMILSSLYNVKHLNILFSLCNTKIGIMVFKKLFERMPNLVDELAPTIGGQPLASQLKGLSDASYLFMLSTKLEGLGLLLHYPNLLKYVSAENLTRVVCSDRKQFHMQSPLNLFSNHEYGHQVFLKLIEMAPHVIMHLKAQDFLYVQDLEMLKSTYDYFLCSEQGQQCMDKVFEINPEIQAGLTKKTI